MGANINFITKKELSYVKEYLGEHYEKLKEYFYQVCISDFLYKVLANRKVKSLLNIFINIFRCYPEEINNVPFEIKGVFVDMDNVLIDKNLLRGRKTLFVNDLVMDYNLLKKDMDLLLSLGVNLTVWCYQSVPVDIDEYDKYFGHVIHKSADDVKRSAYLINNLIKLSNVGYNNTSTIYYAKGELSSLLNENSYYKYDGAEEKAVVFYDYKGILEKFNAKFLIRFSKRNGIIAIKPMLILPDINKYNIKGYSLLLGFFDQEPTYLKGIDSYNMLQKRLPFVLLQRYWDSIGIEYNDVTTFHPLARSFKELRPLNGNGKVSNLINANEELRKELYEMFKNNDLTMSIFDLVNYLKNKYNCKEEDVFVEILEMFDENKLLIKNDLDDVVKTIVTSDRLLYRTWYELHENASKAFYDYFSLTFENRISKLMELARYLDNLYGTLEYTDFVKGVDYHNYTEDMMSFNLNVSNDIQRINRDYLGKIYKP